MNKPDIDLCEKLVKNLKTLKEKDGVFVGGAKKAEERGEKGDWLSLGLPLVSTLTVPARTGLLVLITQLGLEPRCNIRNSYSTPLDLDALIKAAEETIALFR